MFGRKIVAPTTSNGIHFGMFVECKLSGVQGYVTGFNFYLAGCEFVVVTTKTKTDLSEDATAQASLSINNVKIINSDSVDEYEKRYLENAMDRSGEKELGYEVKMYNDDNFRGIINNITYEYSGACFCTITPTTWKKDDKDTLAFINEVDVVSKGIRDKVMDNIEKRHNGDLLIPKTGDKVRCIMNNLEGIVTTITNAMNGTCCLSVQPASVNNKKLDPEQYDVEVLEIIGETQHKDVPEEKKTGAPFFEGHAFPKILC